MLSSVLALPFYSHSLSFPNHPLRGPGSPPAPPQPTSFHLQRIPPQHPPLSSTPALGPHPQRTRSSTGPQASLPAGAGPGPGAGAGHAHHAVLPVPVGALGSPAGRAGAVHGATASRLALLLHLLPRRRAARGRARVPEPRRPRLLRRRESGGRRAGAPRGPGARLRLHSATHSLCVDRSPGSPAVRCWLRARAPPSCLRSRGSSRDTQDTPLGSWRFRGLTSGPVQREMA